jgi:hypothetical protein
MKRNKITEMTPKKENSNRLAIIAVGNHPTQKTKDNNLSNICKPIIIQPFCIHSTTHGAKFIQRRFIITRLKPLPPKR